MRMVVIILALGAIAITLVHVRHTQTLTRHEIQKLQEEQIKLRRTLWDQQVQMGYVFSPTELRRRAEEMGLELTSGARSADQTPSQKP